MKNQDEKKIFFERFRRMAEEEKEVCRYKCSVEEILERMYQENCEWHRKNDARVFLESLTLEQLYILEH